MARQTKKKPSFDVAAILGAAGGGSATNFLMNLADEKVEFLQDKPLITPLAFQALGIGLTMVNDKVKPTGLGMIAVASADIIDQLINKVKSKDESNQGTKDNLKRAMRNPKFKARFKKLMQTNPRFKAAILTNMVGGDSRLKEVATKLKQKVDDCDCDTLAMPLNYEM